MRCTSCETGESVLIIGLLHDDELARLFMVSGKSLHHTLVLEIVSCVAVLEHCACFVRPRITKLYGWNAHEISYKLISFLKSLDKRILTYGDGKRTIALEIMSSTAI